MISLKHNSHKQLVQKFTYSIFNRIRQTRTCQKCLTPFGKILAPDRWIFITGCYNSGTTLLDQILSKHPFISTLPIEGVSLTDSLPRPEDFGWNRMWCRCMDQMLLTSDIGLHERAERIKRQWSIWYPSNPINCVEKSIANTTRMPFLQEYFNPAYFIYIIRNGYAVAEGIQRKSRPARWKNSFYKNGYPIELCAEQWKASDEIVSNDKQCLNRFMQIYYEDLTSRPKQILKGITDFLGLEPLDNKIFDNTWCVHGTKSQLKNMNYLSCSRLSENDVKKIESVAGYKLEEHGYTRPM